MAAENQKGTEGLNQLTIEGSESLPPMKGPMINPIPKAAPMRPKFLALSSGLVKSAIEAEAAEMLPLVIPANPLAKNNSGIDLKIIPKANRT